MAVDIAVLTVAGAVTGVGGKGGWMYLSCVLVVIVISTHTYDMHIYLHKHGHLSYWQHKTAGLAR